eukprot:scaffold364512_cov14-Prasinocladus_malaysianus.AAC.1
MEAAALERSEAGTAAHGAAYTCIRSETAETVMANEWFALVCCPSRLSCHMNREPHTPTLPF